MDFSKLNGYNVAWLNEESEQLFKYWERGMFDEVNRCNSRICAYLVALNDCGIITFQESERFKEWFTYTMPKGMLEEYMKQEIE